MNNLIDLGVRGIAVTGKTDAPVVQLTSTFPLQSYFDNALLEKAILFQPQGQQIVPSTVRVSPVAGYAVGLHPSSQAPIAVRFSKGSQAGDSGVMVLKPGQIVRPNGEQVSKDGRFSGFEWGLPFGWLGGGSVTLVIFRTADAKVFWIDRNEIIFHRQRVQILAPAAVPALVNILPNWPVSFPWASAKSGANALPQGGSPILNVSPTGVAMKLNVDLAAAATMRIYFVGSSAWDQASDGIEDLAAVPAAYDVTWGAWASIASANYAVQRQFQFLPAEAFKLGSILGSAVLVDATGTLAGAYCDIIRYGVL